MKTLKWRLTEDGTAQLYIEEDGIVLETWETDVDEQCIDLVISTIDEEHEFECEYDTDLSLSGAITVDLETAMFEELALQF